MGNVLEMHVFGPTLKTPGVGPSTLGFSKPSRDADACSCLRSTVHTAPGPPAPPQTFSWEGETSALSETRGWGRSFLEVRTRFDIASQLPPLGAVWVPWQLTLLSIRTTAWV